MENEPEPPAPSLGGSASGILLTFLRYVEARFQLLCLEAAEAGGGIGRWIALFLAAATAILLGYLIALALALLLAVRTWGWGWEPVLLCAALFHLLAGAVLAGVAWRRLRDTSYFPESLNELKKDHAWLAKNQTQQP